jgi:hypothetical protein
MKTKEIKEPTHLDKLHKTCIKAACEKIDELESLLKAKKPIKAQVH